VGRDITLIILNKIGSRKVYSELYGIIMEQNFPFINSMLKNFYYIREEYDFLGETRNAHRLLVGKPEGKRPLGRPRRRWVDNIKMDGMEWIGWIWLRIGASVGLL
jgi:hypothetical protein